MVEHRCREGIDSRKRIADGACQMSCTNIGKHLVDAGTGYRSLAVVADPENDRGPTSARPPLLLAEWSAAKIRPVAVSSIPITDPTRIMM
jgi:hypothetical protein